VVTDSGATRGEVFGLAGALFEGRFQIEKRIAEGGFAVVYRAWQLTLERWVALKILKAPRSYDDIGRAEFRQKFADEAKTIARLRHPHIVDVYDFSVSTLPSGELAPWMALEWLEGETLSVRLKERRASGKRGLDPREAVAFLRPVIEAVAYAHEQGIAHRDVKPGNIMVTETAQGPSLRVLDFGIAKIMVDDQWPETGQTRTESAPAFSPAYAAPEQVAFSRTGPWTDVHALGLMLTEVMTDEPPFSDPDPEAHMFEQVMARNRPTPMSKGRDVGLFEPIIGKALALAPRDRWKMRRSSLEGDRGGVRRTKRRGDRRGGRRSGCSPGVGAGRPAGAAIAAPQNPMGYSVGRRLARVRPWARLESQRLEGFAGAWPGADRGEHGNDSESHRRYAGRTRGGAARRADWVSGRCFQLSRANDETVSRRQPQQEESVAVACDRRARPVRGHEMSGDDLSASPARRWSLSCRSPR
jgi:tRNA A-37 threonylcarbamoyl transferase component Bud32